MKDTLQILQTKNKYTQMENSNIDWVMSIAYVIPQTMFSNVSKEIKFGSLKL